MSHLRRAICALFGHKVWFLSVGGMKLCVCQRCQAGWEET